MEAKDKSAIVAWINHVPTRWMLAVSLSWGALSCSSDAPQSEEPVVKSDALTEGLPQEDSEFAEAGGVPSDTSSETIGSLTPDDVSSTSTEDGIEKTLASLSSADSQPSTEPENIPGAAAVEPITNAPSTVREKKKVPRIQSSSALESAPSATYVVTGGDSLSKIAKKIYGHHKHWEDIAALNDLTPPYTIYPGQGLRFPLVNAQAKSFAESYRKNQKTITVQKGDSLSKLAAKVFGNQDSWRRLFNYNKDKILDPNFLPAGITLAYFDGGSEAAIDVKPASQPSVEPVQEPAAPAPEAAPAVQPAPAPPVKQALKAKVAPSVKAPKKAKQEPAPKKKGQTKTDKPNIKISPNDLYSP